MPDPIRNKPAHPPERKTESKGVPEAKPAAAPVQATDQFKPPAVKRGIPTKPSHIEADLGVLVSGQGATANGTVKLSQRLIQSLFEDAFKDCKEFINPTVRYDAAQQQYVVQTQLDLAGPFNPDLSMRLGFQVVNNQLALVFHETSAVGPDSWYANGLIKGFAKSFQAEGIHVKADVKGRRIVFDTESFLHGTVLPREVPVNGKQQQVAVSMDGTGNATIQFKTNQKTESVAATPASDVAITLDRTGLTRVLNNLLGSDFHVKDLTLRPGGATISGEGKWEGGGSLGALFVVFAGAATGHPAADLAMRGSNFTPKDPKIGLDLDVRLEGERMIIKPSLGAAMDQIAESFKKAGIPHQVHKNEISFSLHDVWGNTEGHFDDARLDENGLTLKGHLNADSLLVTPPK